jgi:aspartokinase/homoserine dehydrogenase 1
MLLPERRSVIDWRRELAESRDSTDLKRLVDRLAASDGTGILVDTSTTTGLSDLYKYALDHGIHVVTAVKGSLFTNYPTFKALEERAQNRNVRFLYRSCVGAGLGLAQMVREHVVCGDPPTEMGGVLGGTLSFLLNNFMDRGTRFSDLVAEAENLGLTDPPDPRLDLSGRDAANKLALLLWTVGIPVEVESINYAPLLQLPEGDRSPSQVMTDIVKLDPEMEELKVRAVQAGARLRYVFSYKNGDASMGLTQVDKKHPAWGLVGTQNMLWLKSAAHPEPRFQIGSGAGPEWTSLGVQMDIAKVLDLL